MSTPFNLDSEVRLFATNAEREKQENFATLYSIIVSLEYLERAYVRDSISGKEYAPPCLKLLAQYKSLLKLISSDLSNPPRNLPSSLHLLSPSSHSSNPLPNTSQTSSSFDYDSYSNTTGRPSNTTTPISDPSQSQSLSSLSGLEHFMHRFHLDYPAALHRLQVGVPATVEHSAEAHGYGEGEGGMAEMGKLVAETTQSFITFMDALKLNLRAKDRLHPFLAELMSNYSRIKGSGEWEGRGKILHWLIELNAMKASDEISEEQSRQMLFDIENAYNEFFRSLSGKRRE